MDFLEFSEARCKKINDGASYLKKQQKKNIITLEKGHPETWGTLGKAVQRSRKPLQTKTPQIAVSRIEFSHFGHKGQPPTP